MKEKLQELEGLDSHGNIEHFMQMKVICAPMGMFPTVGSLKMRIFIFRLRRQQNLISLVWLPKKIIYNKRIHQCRQAYGLSWQVLSFELKKKTVIILDNASVHRNRKIKEQRKIWKDRGLFLFYLPYSPELNSSETLWRILKGKWIRPVEYNTKTRFSIV